MSEPLLVTVAEAGARLGVSRSKMFEEVAAGRWSFAVVKVGRETRLSWPAVERFLVNPAAVDRFGVG